MLRRLMRPFVKQIHPDFHHNVRRGEGGEEVGGQKGGHVSTGPTPKPFYPTNLST